MAATKSQGKSFTLFMVGLTAACAGIAYFTTGVGKVALLIGLVAVAISLFEFFKIKPLEGRTGAGAQPAALKLAGVVVVLLGWVVVLLGLHLTAGVGGRMVMSIIGIAISLGGIFFLLAPASSKNAIWKA
ncbi:MAG TPA: hypothetical protein VHX20_08210 [Terracidiphilus sp.]|jgi:uncharacterized membrane protein|nr:hypothetical protein [Terracidiphilus sp.]